MTLKAGAWLCPDEILAPIGAGGMGGAVESAGRAPGPHRGDQEG
jgi:hypothetical protein